MTSQTTANAPRRPDEERAAARLLVSGLVQGVYYRATCAEKARELGLVGWVRNLPDGRVEALAEGPRPAIHHLISWCWQGPPAARVSDVRVQWQDPSGQHTEFQVHR